jgi:flagellar assembly factor FliW
MSAGTPTASSAPTQQESPMAPSLAPSPARSTTPTLPSAGSDRTDPELPVLDMVQPLVGFPDRRHFALARLDESGLVCDLRSLEDPELRFVVVPPSPFFADYDPAIDDAVAEELGVENDDDLLALLVVTLGATPDSATANLAAPVLVNHRTRRAGQYLLADAELSMRAPLSGSAARASA